MSHRITLLTFLLSISYSLFSQGDPSVLRATDIPALKALSEKWESEYGVNIEKAKAEALRLGMPLKQELENGSIIELAGINEQGHLLYRSTDNLNAARTLSTDKVWPGGITGYNLTGDTLTVGEWDAGKVRLTHQEFTNRASMGDNASNLHDHSTHVGATMIAAGVDSLAKGMAFQASLIAHDWNNDNSEMASAAANGLLISNHSYGYVSGWYGSSQWWGDTTLSGTEDYKFGYYISGAKDWDQIAYLAPYYLICKAAGNDRNDAGSGHHTLPEHSGAPSSTPRPKDGGVSGYDCILPIGNAKNIMTVGAVNAIPSGYSSPSDVVMSSFSGWGPTDDGRIKPDIVANGVAVYSALSTSDTSYASWSGTSMATPNAAGSMLLLQQLYYQENGKFMKAATLKGLVIHTADEAGSATGPDYRFGWGLMNTRRAADHIADTTGKKDIVEASLFNNQVFSFEITSTGTDPITATICWTDIPGTVPAYAVDPSTHMLVHDLDLRIMRNSDSTMYYPFKLNPASPSSAATTGDNNVDNVEQVFIANPTSGIYTVTITHKGSLQTATQDFSLLLDGGKASPQDPVCMYTVTQFPDIQDFENFTNCSTTAGSACTLPSGIGWANDSLSDDIDWTIDNGGTPSGSTGPSTDYDPGTSQGKYAYTEASTSGTGFPDKKAILYTPCYDLDTVTNAELVFAYSMDGQAMGSLRVDAYDGYGWQPIWSRSGAQGSSWLVDTVDLSSYDGQKIMLRFVGRTGTNYTSDMAIDAIQVREFNICETYTMNVGVDTIGNPVICSGDSAYLIAGGGQHFQWYRDGQKLIGDSQVVIKTGIAGSYNVVATDSNSCSDSAAAPVAIVVNALPLVTISSTGSTSFCSGDSTTLSTTSGTNWQWTKNGASISNATSNTLVVSDPALYNVSVGDSNNCYNTADSATNIIVFPLPNGSITANGREICAGDSIFIMSSYGYTYQWSLKGVNIPGGKNRTIFVSDSGLVSVMFTDTNQCRDTASIFIAMNPLPSVSFDSLPIFCYDKPPYLLNQGKPVGTTGYYSGPGVMGLNPAYFDPNVAGLGNHTVWYTYVDANFCQDSASQVARVEICAGLEEGQKSGSISLYPNPSDGKFYLNLNTVETGYYNLYVLNELGDRIYASAGNKYKEGIRVELDLSRHPKGIYFVQLQLSGTVWSQKLILE